MKKYLLKIFVSILALSFITTSITILSSCSVTPHKKLSLFYINNASLDRKPAHSKDLSSCSLLAKKFIALPLQDSSVELEIATYNTRVIDLLTTTDGTLLPIFGKENPPIEFITELDQALDLVKIYKKIIAQKDGKKSFKSRFGLQKVSLEDINLSDIPWDYLDDIQKLQAVSMAATYRKVLFRDNRKVPGIMIRPRVKVNFDNQTVLLGKTYKEGMHEIDTTDFLGPVEYMSEKSVESFNGVELHFRSKKVSAGQLSNDASVFLESVGIPRVHQHVHIVTKLPLDELTSRPVLETTRVIEFFRRINLISEFLTVMSDSASISRNEVNGIVYFDNLSFDRLKGVTHYFTQIAQGNFPEIGDNFKMGWIGMRGSDKYDTPGLWGLEYRNISKNINSNNIKAILNSLQWHMSNKEYGIPAAQIEEWLKKVADGPSLKGLPTTLPYRLWYTKDSADLVYGLQVDRLQKYGFNIESFKDPTFIKKLDHFKTNFKEVKMLFYDWANDPLFFKNTEMQERIYKAQANYLNSLKTNILDPLEDSTPNLPFSEAFEAKGLAQMFLESTGILRVFFKSIDVEIY